MKNDDGVNRQPEMRYFTTPDGIAVRWGAWACRAAKPAGTIVLLQGRAEFMEKYTETIQARLQDEYAVYSLDWRGQGLSGRMLNDRLKGHVESCRDYIDDLDQFIRERIIPEAPPPFFLLAHSLGAHIGLRYLHRNAAVFRSAVLSAAMLDIRTWPMPRRLAEQLARMAVKHGRSYAYVPGAAAYRPDRMTFKNNRLTHDARRFHQTLAAIRQNPDLAVGGVTWGWLAAAFDSINTINSPGYLSAVGVPTLIVSAGNDRIVCNRAHQIAAGRLPDSRHATIPGARHEIMMESDAIQNPFWEWVLTFFQ